MLKLKQSFSLLTLLSALCAPAVSSTLTGGFTFHAPVGVGTTDPYIGGDGVGSYSFSSSLLDNLADNATTTVNLSGLLTSFRFSVQESLQNSPSPATSSFLFSLSDLYSFSLTVSRQGSGFIPRQFTVLTGAVLGTNPAFGMATYSGTAYSNSPAVGLSGISLSMAPAVVFSTFGLTIADGVLVASDVPEPATLPLAASALAACWLIRRRAIR